MSYACFLALLAGIAEPLTMRKIGPNWQVCGAGRPLPITPGNFAAIEILRVGYEVERLELRRAAAPGVEPVR